MCTDYISNYYFSFEVMDRNLWKVYDKGNDF